MHEVGHTSSYAKERLLKVYRQSRKCSVITLAFSSFITRRDTYLANTLASV